MAWCFFSYRGDDELEIINGRMDCRRYRALLEKDLLKSAVSLEHDGNFLF